ncbi:MAG: PAS domain S-box protein [Candidatus Nitrohelix vancouverensis]|uniref:histidine kinase n=1 Tax=Candidatus Nitrohelix vancouverensis TaxID=2705534 RepID=A0A7T0C3U7_9BACT|nr:MAG: PAS domain S-box protein [Candidatus Nitrohelix vancouverensis]
MNNQQILGFGILLGALFFYLDTQIELGVAAGIPHVSLVLLGLWSKKRRFILLGAITGSLLTLWGLYFSPLGGEEWKILTNRGLALFAIWTTAGLCFLYHKKHTELETLNQELDDRVTIAVNDLKHLETQNTNILNNLIEGIVSISQDGAILSVNPAVSNMFLYSASELTGQNITLLFPHHCKPHYDKLIDVISSEDSEFSFIKNIELEGRKKNAEEFPIIISLSVIHENDSRYYVASIRDITEIKSIEKQLRNKMEELERSNQDLEDFAMIASHDIKAPLRKIITFSEMYNRGATETERLEKNDFLVSRIHDSAVRLSVLLENILEYSRIGTQNVKLIRTNDLNEIISEALRNVENRLERREQVFKIEPLPKMACNRTQIMQLFQNLASNSIKYANANKPLSVEISGEKLDNGLIEIIYRDNGTGFKQEYAQRVFKPFERLVPDSEHDGVGMGLAICKKVVVSHGGEISVKTSPGNGVEFCIQFPERTDIQ